MDTDLLVVNCRARMSAESNAGNPLGIQAVHHMPGDLVPLAERLRQPPPRGDRPPQVHLLGTDAADQRREEVELADLADAWESTVESGQDDVSLEQVGVGRGRRDE